MVTVICLIFWLLEVITGYDSCNNFSAQENEGYWDSIGRCGSCNSIENCGFCLSTLQCLEGDGGGPFNSLCNSWASISSLCPGKFSFEESLGMFLI